MSAYTKSTDFASKDVQLTGSPSKVIKGTEIDDELNSIQTAVNSKADINSPDLTGTPTAPTASSGTNTTQIASTAFVQAALAAVYPVGSVYINATSTNNPNTLLGFGTWIEFGSGKVVVGQDTGDSDFDSLEETGGSKTHNHGGSTGGHSLTEAQMPKHYHEYVAPGSITSPQGGTSGYGIYGGGTPDDGALRTGTWSVGGGASSGSTSTGTGNGNSHSHSINSQDNMQPYIVVKMWKRTA